MKRIALLFALVLVVAACGDDDSSATTQASTATTAAEAMTDDSTTDDSMTDDSMSDESMTDDSMSDESMSDESMTDDSMTEGMSAEGAIFEISMVTFDSPMVVITNVGTETGNLSGHWLCQRPSYQELPDIEVGPGEFVAISLGGNVFLPPPGALTIDQTLNLGGITASSGEIGLYSSNAFGSADAMVSYVEWGSSGHGRSQTAVEAGLWDEGGFVATTDETAGIRQETTFSMASTGWSSF